MDAPRVSQSALRLFASDMVLPHGSVDAGELMLTDVIGLDSKGVRGRG